MKIVARTQNPVSSQMFSGLISHSSE